MYCCNCMSYFDDNADYCPVCHQKPYPNNFTHHLRAGTVLDGKYLVGNSIGEGGFGITYIGRDLTLDLRIAIKEFYPNGYANRNNNASNDVSINYSNNGEYFKQGMDKFLMEAQNIAKFSAERGIVDVRDYFKENNTAYIIMEYLDGITLSDKIKRDGVFSAADTFTLMLPVMHSLENMHRAQILHRDISPDNIMLLRDGTLKLMDFGSARYFTEDGSKTMSVMLKPGYAPYEQYNSSGYQGPWTDVYGLCATIYKCITGNTPKDSLDRCRVDSLALPSRSGANISQPLENVLMYGLAVYPENRCQSMQELISITQQALNDNAFYMQNQGGGSDYQADPEEYRTVFAEGSVNTDNYGDSYNTGYMHEGVGNYADKKADKNANKKQEKNNKKKLIIILVVAAVLLIGIITAAALMIINNNNSKSALLNSSSNSSSVRTVPGVVGKNVYSAVKILENEGFVPEIKWEYSSSYSKDRVMSQTPAAGSRQKKGTTVTMYVSKGAKVVYTEPTTEEDTYDDTYDTTYSYDTAPSYTTQPTETTTQPPTTESTTQPPSSTTEESSESDDTSETDDTEEDDDEDGDDGEDY